MKKHSLILIAALGFSTTSQSAPLYDVYQKAMNYNDAIKASEQQLEAQKANSSLAQSSLLPKFGVQAQAYRADVDISSSNYQTDYNGVNYSAKFTQPLYDAKGYEQYYLSKENEQTSKNKLTKKKASETLELMNAYFNYLRFQNLFTISDKKQKAIQSRYDKAQKEYELGAINLLALNEAENALDQVKVQRIEQQGNVDIAQENLAQLTGQYYKDLSDIETDSDLFSIKMDLEYWTEKALKNNYDLQHLKSRKEAAQKKVDVAQAELKPDLDFFVSFEHQDRNDDPNLQGGDRDDLVFGIEFDYPIFTGGSTINKSRKAQHEATGVGYQYTDTVRSVRAEVKKVYRNIELTKRNIDAKSQALSSAEKSLDATQKGYRLGQRNYQDLLNAEQAYYDALLSYNNSKYDYIIQYLNLKYLAGELNEKTVLELSQWLNRN